MPYAIGKKAKRRQFPLLFGSATQIILQKNAHSLVQKCTHSQIKNHPM